MSYNKGKKQSYRAVLAGVREEMAEPRVPEFVHVEAEKQRTATVKEGAKK